MIKMNNITLQYDVVFFPFLAINGIAMPANALFRPALLDFELDIKPKGISKFSLP